jgi:outer membrane protein insertion porin family
MMDRTPIRDCLGKATALAAAFFAVMGLSSPTVVAAQDQQVGLVAVDTVIVEGNSPRIQDQSILALFGVLPGTEITYRDIQRGIKTLMHSGQFKDVVVRARGTSPVELVIQVEEYPRVRVVQMNGLENVSARSVRDTTGLSEGLPYNPQHVLDAKAFIRTELAADGIPYAQITERIEPVPGEDNRVDILLDIVEGQRVTVAQMQFIGNEAVSDDQLRGSMSIKSEGFWWFRSGSFDEIRFAEDLTVKLPQLYSDRGYLDFRIVSDTVISDPNTGKSILVVEVDEGEQYRLGAFLVEGNRRFTTEQLEGYFKSDQGGLLSSIGFGGGGEARGQEGDVFDAGAFQEAVAVVQEQYRNEGYLYAQVVPVVDKVPSEDDGPPTINATWQITEGSPALVNRVSISGNEYTYEWVIRNQVLILPGDVYSQDRVMRSYQNVSALGFFEAPGPFPDIVPNEEGDVDITFNVVEKQTGSINFGTSLGGGVGLSGFIGYQQPNLFGQAKAGNLRWDFGRFLNSFEASYSDPALFQSLVSGSLTLFNSRDRFFQFSTGRRRRVGMSTRFGFPWPRSRVSRVFVGYGLSQTKYEQFSDSEDTSLFGRPPGVQSQLTLGVTRQTLNHPLFPTAGSRQNINIETNGGLLGGDGKFTRVLADANWWIPIGAGGLSEGGAPGGLQFALGLTIKTGAVFGDASAFPFDRFWMGGVQFGQNLRGYDETTITPAGYFAERTGGINDIERLGNAFLSVTAEYAVRMGGQVGLSFFYDAGNVWRDPGDFDPTRMFRGAGVGMSLVTPFGPIGLDYAYGFDKTEPGWQLHFRMGPGF